MNIQENQFAVILRKHAEENGDDSSFFSQKQSIEQIENEFGTSSSTHIHVCCF